MSVLRISASLVVGCLVGCLAGCQVATPAEPPAEPVSDDNLDLEGGSYEASALSALTDDPSDCSLASTVLGPQWQPTSTLRIPVVVHIIADANCTTGAVSNQDVANQIASLNEDYRATPGTPGQAGADSRIEFVLATTDPAGQPTTGITRDCNATWYRDKGNYYNTLAWDTSRYMNLYVNSAAGSRGYTFLPADPAGPRGTKADRIVINHLAFGRPGPFAPYNLGRTVTHETGHYLGLFHTYFDGCGVPTAPSCYTTGDRLCDTAPNATSHKGCPVITACGGVTAPVHNYMELTDDACLTGFTAEQVQRMRCSLATYRPLLTTP
ncbi:MAG: zinc metalloprotease [Myxococcales bacterium]|nr:zinc metalloprotease [Myxococcales bacterium]